jgi:hypothetical protein
MLKLNQHSKNRIGANWKIDENKGEQEVKTEYYAGINMPLKNGDPLLDYGNSNSFRARPIKHPRRQYGSNVPGANVGSVAVSNTKNPMFIIDRPGASVITNKQNTLCNNTNTDPQCCNNKAVPDYKVAVRTPRDCLNTCNTSNICINEQKNALKRVRGGALLKNPLQTVDGVDTLVNYYSNTGSYLNNRVKVDNANACDCVDSTTLKASKIFKPNNRRFITQGPVTASTQIADIKRQTKSAFNWGQQGVNAADFCCVDNNINTIATSRRLGGTDEAPYTEKSKTYFPIVGQRTLFKRSNGNKNVCCQRQ